MPDIKIEDNCLFEVERRMNVYLNSNKLEQLENQHAEKLVKDGEEITVDSGRKMLIKKKDIHYIKRDFNINGYVKRHEVDAVSVKLWAQEMKNNGASVGNNSTLSDSQKLQYFKLSVKGEAATLLQSIQITNDNYKKAWNALTERYENEAEIINAALNKLVSQPILKQESASGLRKLITVTTVTFSGHMAREASLHPISEKYIGTTVGCILLACRKQLIGRANRWSNFLGRADF
ncbi:uncharacterized protein TNCV_4536541 [Trichonephila clavipes]|nr:uncharacterized protein TNCV_4536541 [Trichonephila clavipes]